MEELIGHKKDSACLPLLLKSSPLPRRLTSRVRIGPGLVLPARNVDVQELSIVCLGDTKDNLQRGLDARFNFDICVRTAHVCLDPLPAIVSSSQYSITGRGRVLTPGEMATMVKPSSAYDWAYCTVNILRAALLTL